MENEYLENVPEIFDPWNYPIDYSDELEEE